jgi:phage anti-repressor protein
VKALLERIFIKDIDYKILLYLEVEQHKKHGGHNKEKIMLTINAFKRLCLKAGTKKADQIHEYYIKLEELLHESVNEESHELKLQLQNQVKEREYDKKISEKEKEILLEKTLLEQFPKNSQCIYYGKIDDKSIAGETLIKFGNSNNLAERVEVHKKTYTNFRLTGAFKVSNKIHMENELKKDPNLKKKRRNILIDNVNYTELLAIDNLSYEEIDQKIKQIITETEYNIENYTRLLDRNAELEKENSRLVEEIEKVSAKAKESDDKLTEILPVIGHRETKLQKMTFAGIPKQ